MTKKKCGSQIAAVLLTGIWLSAVCVTSPQEPPIVHESRNATLYAGIISQCHAPKLDAGSGMERVCNISIPAKAVDATVQKKERTVVEIAGIVKDPEMLIRGEITEHKPMPVDLSDISCNVPNGEAGCKSAVKTYMSYRAITAKNSPQYQLQTDAVTDPASGIRMVDGCYLVAVGTYYADHVGQKLRVTMTSGLQVACMVGEFKSDRHTDATHRYHVGGYERGVYYKGDGSVLEFIVDPDNYRASLIPEVFDGSIYNITAR